MAAEQIYTDEDIIEAITIAEGYVSDAAELLGCSTTTIHTRINRVPAVKALMDSFRDRQIDNAERVIHDRVQRQKESAARFLLSTIGRKRGWGDVVQVEHAGKIVVDMPDGWDDSAKERDDARDSRDGTGDPGNGAGDERDEAESGE